MRLRLVLLTLLTVMASMGAQHRTPNFIVTAPSMQIAQHVGQWAEHYRREKAQQWLGYEMPTWNQPCPLRVIVEQQAPQGKTSFNYINDQVASMDMEIQGPLDRLVYSVLPHEITHTVFAHYFRCAVPRWADEGGSVLSEDTAERQRHDQMTRDVLNHRQGFRLRTLMSLTEYPNDQAGVMWLYAEGFSLVDFLVKQSDHRTFLKFVAHGMRTRSWDRAVQDYFGLRTVEELEEAWLKHLRDTRKGASSDQFAQNQRPAENTKPKTFVRTSLPPAQPLDPVPVFRGAAPGPDQTGRRFADMQTATMTPPISIPNPGNSNWQQSSTAAVPYQPATVPLGQPQYSPSQYAQPYNPSQWPAGQGQCNGPNCQAQQPGYPQQYGYPR